MYKISILGKAFACPKSERKGLKIHNITKIDIISSDKLQHSPKNEKTRWKMFADRKNAAQKNAREISGLFSRNYYPVQSPRIAGVS